MRLPAFSTSFVAVCLAIVTASGMTTVRTGAPRERERAVRMTRGSGQRLDSAEAVHGHEDTSVAADFSGEPKLDASARPRRIPTSWAFVAGAAGRPGTPVLPVAVVPLPPQSALQTTLIPPVPGRAPPTI